MGSDENKLSILIMEEMMERGLAGMVSSPMFEENIAIVVRENKEYDYYFIAGFSQKKKGAASCVFITKELLDELRDESPMAKTIFLHEIGHYANSDVEIFDEKNDDRRREFVKQNKASPKEIKADEFAVGYLGRETVINGLKELKDRILAKCKDYDPESIKLSVKEIDIRISYLLETNG